MMSWEEYIKSNILEFRKRYEELPEESRQLLEKEEIDYGLRLAIPCQVIAIDFTKPYQKSFIITNSKAHPDMQIVVFKDAEFNDFLDRAADEPRLKALLNPDNITNVTQALRKNLSEQPVHWIDSANYTSELLLLSFAEDPRSEPYTLADHFFFEVTHELSDLMREKHRREIEETVDDLKRDAEAIPVGIELRNKILENTQRLDGQIKQLNDKVEQEISALRKLIGSSESVQDWRLLISDVHRLKGEHVPKEVFESRIKELSTKIEAFEKIEKAYERLSSQQEKVLEQQSSFIKWIKYSTILVPIAVACIPIIEIIIRHFLGSL